MNYDTIFEVTWGGLISFAFALPGLLFIGVGVFAIKNQESLAGRHPQWAFNFVGWVFVCFSTLWTLVATLVIGLEYYRLSKAYVEGDFMVVEGVVEKFEPMPQAGRPHESFWVNGVKFSYSDYEITPAFNNAASHGGPIYEGLPVRISYVGNKILKLQVASEDEF